MREFSSDLYSVVSHLLPKDTDIFYFLWLNFETQSFSLETVFQIKVLFGTFVIFSVKY